MNFKKLRDEMDNELKRVIEQHKKEIDQSIWHTRKYLRENALSPQEKKELNETCYILINHLKEEFSIIEEDVVTEFLLYLEKCKQTIDDMLK